MRWAPFALDTARLLMEVAWISVAGAIVGVLIGAQGSLIPLWLAMAVMFLGYAMTRMFIPDDVPLTMARGWMMGVGAIVIYASIVLVPGVGLDVFWPLRLSEDWLAARHVLIGGTMLGVFWWRGTRLGQERVWVYSLAQSFRIGVAVIVAGAVAHILLPVSLGATPATFLFFTAGIGAFALQHITSMAPEESAGLRDWPRTMALTVGSILAGSILVAVVAEGDIGRISADAFGVVLWVLTPFVAVIGWVLELIFQGLAFGVMWLVSLFNGDGGGQAGFALPPPPNFDNVRRPAEGSNAILFTLLRVASWIIVLLLAIGIVRFLWRAFDFRSRRRNRSEDEERERLESEGSFGDDLSAALAHLMSGMRRGRGKRRQAGDGLDQNDPRAVALGAYRGLLALAEEHGVERERWRTPGEFDEPLRDLFPENDVGLFTKAFTRARYGIIPPTEAEIAQIRATWRALQAIPVPEGPRRIKDAMRKAKIYTGPLPKGPIEPEKEEAGPILPPTSSDDIRMT